MNKFELKNNIDKDLYAPVGATKQALHKFGKYAMIVFCSTASVSSVAEPEHKSFTIEACSSDSDIEHNQYSWKQIYSLFSDKEKLVIQVRQLPSSVDWEEFGMEKPTEQIIANTISIIEHCSVESLLKKVKVFPRVNGTVLLKWNDEYRLATMNIGSVKYSYAILSRTNASDYYGEELVTDTESVELFYKRLEGGSKE